MTEGHSAHVIGGDVRAARYDRQLRLWGKSGQRALQDAHVVALGATAAVTEALKSIVLTGVAAITVIDERTVNEELLSSNFFLEDSDVGDSLSHCVVRHLCSMNKDCAGISVNTISPTDWAAQYAASKTLEEEEALMLNGGVVVANHDADFILSRCKSSSNNNNHSNSMNVNGGGETQSAPQQLRATAPPSLILVSNRISEFNASCSPLLLKTRTQKGIPCVCIESRGLLGFCQSFANNRVIVRTHVPAHIAMRDLRIFSPFPALKEWFDAHDPDDKHLFPENDVNALVEHSHIPPPCIIYHAHRRWLHQQPEGQASKGVPPYTDKIYKELREVMSSMVRRISPPQEAFEEASAQCKPLLNRPYAGIPQNLVALFNDARCENPMLALGGAHAWVSLLHEDVLVWFVLHAVHKFYVESSVLPLCGYVPDMVTTTRWYQELSQIYATKHAEDVSRIVDVAMGAIRDAQVAAGATAVVLSPNMATEEGNRGVADALNALTEDVVRNIWSVCLVSFDPVVETEAAWRTFNGNRIVNALSELAEWSSEKDMRNVCLSVCLFAAFEVQRRYARVPGAGKDGADDILQMVESLIAEVMADAEWKSLAWYTAISGMLRQCSHEVQRSGSTEVACVAAAVGAIAAQESVNLIQRHRVPAGQPLVYNGIDNFIHVFK